MLFPFALGWAQVVDDPLYQEVRLSFLTSDAEPCSYDMKDSVRITNLTRESTVNIDPEGVARHILSFNLPYIRNQQTVDLNIFIKLGVDSLDHPLSIPVVNPDTFVQSFVLLGPRLRAFKLKTPPMLKLHAQAGKYTNGYPKTAYFKWRGQTEIDSLIFRKTDRSYIKWDYEPNERYKKDPSNIDGDFYHPNYRLVRKNLSNGLIQADWVSKERGDDPFTHYSTLELRKKRHWLKFTLTYMGIAAVATGVIWRQHNRYTTYAGQYDPRLLSQEEIDHRSTDLSQIEKRLNRSAWGGGALLLVTAGFHIALPEIQYHRFKKGKRFND